MGVGGSNEAGPNTIPEKIDNNRSLRYKIRKPPVSAVGHEV